MSAALSLVRDMRALDATSGWPSLVMRNLDSVDAQSRFACAELSELRWDKGRVSSARLVAAG